MARTKTSELGTNWKAFWHPVKDAAPDRGRHSLINYGPEHLGGRFETHLDGGPRAFTEAHPELFATASTTAPEGWFFWGCVQELGPMGPEGGWQYQRAVRPDGNKIGSARVDFVFESDPKPLAIRIKTPYWHRDDPEITASDREQFAMLEDAGYEAVDVPTTYMDDETGLSVRRMVRRVRDRDPILLPGSALYYEE
jgi:hypothetical protein